MSGCILFPVMLVWFVIRVIANGLKFGFTVDSTRRIWNEVFYGK